MKKNERRDVGRIGDGEGVERRQEEEIVAQRRDATLANSDGHRPKRTATPTIGGQEHQVDVLDADPGLDQFGRSRAPIADGEQRRSHRGADRTARVARAARTVFFGIGSPAMLLAGDDMDADIAGAAHQIVHHRAVQDLEPARARRFADDDLGDVVGLRVADDVVGDAAVAAGMVTASPPSASASRSVSAMRSRSSSVSCSAAPAFDIERDPRRRAGGRRAAWRSAPGRRSAGPR